MQTCTHPGCGGVVEDGYCNVCGMAPAGPAPGATSPAARAPIGHAATPAAPATTASGRTSTGSSRSTGSGRVPTTRSGRSTRSTRSGSSRSGRTGSRVVGSRPLARPALPPLDPLAALVPGVVPERKRFCSNCDVQLKRDAGFCPKCGQEYSFIPSLKEGDLVAGKYEVKGTIAFGGLGWIYLAIDTVLNRWVTLKGLLNSKDPRMLELAVSEREFLASVKHPNIVGIYDFVTQGEQGFIVMEYVNGKTLMTLRKEAGGPLPVAEAISYVAEILPAFSYLDNAGLVYCDFKPENVMVEEETVKLIDMGAVRRDDDTGGDIYGSRGYTAPEAHQTPTALSDLYSVARALAVCVAAFDFQGKYENSLPPPEECPVFAQHDGLYRFLRKATRDKPEQRFQSAAEMAEQLVGVLRGIVGATPELGPYESSLFGVESDRLLAALSEGDSRPHLRLPHPLVDRQDVGANVVLAAEAVREAERRHAMFERALKSYPQSIELRFRVADELISLGHYADASKRLDELRSELPFDWRTDWYRARSALAQGHAVESIAGYAALIEELPGEFAPRQALGVAYEASGQLDRAIAYYDGVSRADPTFTAAALSLARVLLRRAQPGDRALAADAYRRVPPTSSRYVQAQMGLAHALIRDDAKHGSPSADDIVQAAAAVEAVDGLVDGVAIHELRARVLEAGVAFLSAGGQPTPGTTLLGAPFSGGRVGALRTSAEAAFRGCARVVGDEAARVRFVDEANRVRPRTWV